MEQIEAKCGSNRGKERKKLRKSVEEIEVKYGIKQGKVWQKLRKSVKES